MSQFVCRRQGVAVLAGLCLLSAFYPGKNLMAQPEDNPEVGGSAPTTSADIDLPKLTLLSTRLEITAQYTDLGDEDMQDIYGGLPLLAVSLSARAARGMRTFVSLGYGHRSGDPYRDRAGISDPHGATISVVPLQIGVRLDGADSERIRVNFAAALELAWVRETLPAFAPGQTGRLASSGVMGGYHLTFGPEWLLGSGGTSVGFEMGWGGSKGSVRADNHRHDVNLTGLQGRLYAALAI